MLIMKRLFTALVVSITVAVLCSCQLQEERIDGEYSENVKLESNKKDDKEEYNPEGTVSEKESPSLTREEVKALADTALEKLKSIPEYPEGYPTLDDVVSQYKRTCEAIGWIVGTELVATDGDHTHQAHGMKYYKVLPDCYLGSAKAGKNPDAEKLIYNKETLEAYLATLIDEEEAHEYILDITESFEIPRFTQSKNGELYALPYAFPAAGYGENDTFELVVNGDGSYTLSVHYTTLDEEDNVDGEHTYNVKYVKKDGRWVFENFRLVKQH